MINFFTGSLRKIDKELWARDTEGRQMGLNPYSQSVQPSRVLPPVYDEKNDKDDDGDSLLFFFCDHLLCARLCSQYFPWIISDNHLDLPLS